MMKAQRALKDIEMDLSHAVRGKTSNMLEIGKLLNEAKTLVEHGEWFPWLRRDTALPARTAQQYMAAAAWADAKNATVAYLELDYLSPGAIYALASGRYTEETVEQVLAAAATRQRHIGEADVREIAKAGAKAAFFQGIEADQKAEAEAEAARLLSLAKAKGFEPSENRPRWKPSSTAGFNGAAWLCRNRHRPGRYGGVGRYSRRPRKPRPQARDPAEGYRPGTGTPPQKNATSNC
jgi:hypothetical protein